MNEERMVMVRADGQVRDRQDVMRSYDVDFLPFLFVLAVVLTLFWKRG